MLGSPKRRPEYKGLSADGVSGKLSQYTGREGGKFEGEVEGQDREHECIDYWYGQLGLSLTTDPCETVDNTSQ